MNKKADLACDKLINAGLVLLLLLVLLGLLYIFRDTMKDWWQQAMNFLRFS